MGMGLYGRAGFCVFRCQERFLQIQMVISVITDRTILTSSPSNILSGGGGGPKLNFHSCFSSVLGGFLGGRLAPAHNLAATDILGGPRRLQNLRIELGTNPGNSCFTW